MSIKRVRARYQFGATLLEILVVVAIIIIMSGFGLVNYRGIQANNELRDTAEQVKNAILETQALALGPRIDAASGIIAYTIRFQSPTNGQYEVFEGTTSIPGRRYTLPSGLSFQNLTNWPAAPYEVVFSIVEQGKIISTPVDASAPWRVQVASARVTGVCQELAITKQTGRVEISQVAC